MHILKSMRGEASIKNFIFLSVVLLSSTAEAQTTITANVESTAPLPIITFEVEDRDSKGFHKYFISHKANVSLEKASADIDECLRYAMGANEAGIQLFPPVPKFVPLEDIKSYQSSTPKAHSGEYGLVGDVMAALIVPGVNLALGQANVRRCMGYKNYDRYGVSKTEWKSLHEVKYSQKVKWLAQIASASAPNARKLSK